MKKLILPLLLTITFQSLALSSWLEKLDSTDKKEQLAMRWIASGGEIDIQFMHQKLNTMKIQLSPQPQFPNKPWSENHLVFSIKKDPELKLQVPYGSIEKVTAGSLSAQVDFSLTYKDKNIHITKLTFIPNKKNDADIDIVTFKIFDQKGRHIFNTNNVHIQYSKDRKLLQMKHMDMSASKSLSKLLSMPELNNQLLGQMHSYSHLSIPKNAQFSIKGGTCLTNPQFQDNTNYTDVLLVDMPTRNSSDQPINWVGNVSGTNHPVIVPSAELMNIGTADIPWFLKFTDPSTIPYDSDQHPYLLWNVYREVDNRFEQIGSSGLKHAFFSTNSICSCPSGQILGVGCGDIYGRGSNDIANSLGPRTELEANTGIWGNCGSFFDPNCTGSQTQTSGSRSTGLNRLSLNPVDIGPDLYMQPWYIVRDDINIFNSMGYKKFSPTLINTTWVMNTQSTFTNGAALDNYVSPNTISSTQASQTQSTNEGHFTVAVKVVDLGNGLYRYNYAIENYDFDPRFTQFNIPFNLPITLINPIFSDSDGDESNDWSFDVNNGELRIIGNVSNEQDWGMLFSFSFTIFAPPQQGTIILDVASPVLNNTVSSLTLIPDLSSFMFVSGFE